MAANVRLGEKSRFCDMRFIGSQGGALSWRLKSEPATEPKCTSQPLMTRGDSPALALPPASRTAQADTKASKTKEVQCTTK